nr:Gfo/Idh/MocA family oxidoreductase [Brevundimonas denitrificans]
MAASVNASAINVALVGYGYAGRVFHAPLIRATPGLALHTVVSSRPEDVHAELPDVRVVGDVEAMLADPAIGLMVIATPNALHAPLARRAIEAGLAVVVDKPFTVTVAEARALQTLSEDKGGFLTVFHNRAWDADFLTIQQLIRDRRLGRITRFEVTSAASARRCATAGASGRGRARESGTIWARIWRIRPCASWAARWP